MSIVTGIARLSGVCDDGATIELYYFPKGQPDKGPDGASINAPIHALETAQGAINHDQKLFGVLPLKRFVVIEGDFADGMEFSGIVFVGHQWFQAYDGKPDSWLTLITAHEIAHQWFYSLVSSNQALFPYLDEAFATYSEYLYIEDQYPGLATWWWQFRVKAYSPTGFVDSTIYDYPNTRLYINAVYLQGVTLIHAIRERIGETDFFAWLHTYLTRQAGRVATSADLWNAMSDDDYARTADLRAKFLRQPDPRHPVSTPYTPIPASTSIPAAH
jgi:hypothetical protein